jgi:hypothetical protein
MTSKELLLDLVPFRTATPTLALAINDRSVSIVLTQPDEGDACSFYKLIFPDAKFCYIVAIKWDGMSTLKQLIEAIDLSRACTNDLKCERYSCLKTGKECIFRVVNGLDSEASRSVQDERGEMCHLKFLHNIQDTLFNKNEIYNNTKYSLEWHVNTIPGPQLHALVEQVYCLTTSRGRHILASTTVSDTSDMDTEFDDDDDATIAYCSSPSDSHDNQSVLATSNRLLPFIDTKLTQEDNDRDVRKVDRILRMQHVTTMPLSINPVPESACMFTRDLVGTCILSETQKNSDVVVYEPKIKLTGTDIHRKTRPVPNNLPYFSDEYCKSIGKDKATIVTSGVRSVGGKKSDLIDAFSAAGDAKFEVLPVGFNLYTGGDLYPIGTAVVLAVKRGEAKELHVESIQCSNNKRSKCSFVIAVIVNVLYLTNRDGYLCGLKGVFGVILPPNRSGSESDGVELKPDITELELPVDAIIGSVSNFNESQIRYLLPPYVKFMKDFPRYKDVTKIDVGMERGVQASLKENPHTLSSEAWVYLYFTDTGAGLYTAMGRIIVHIVTQLLQAIQIDDIEMKLQVLEDCLLGDVLVTSTLSETDETTNPDWFENTDCVLCQRLLQSQGATTTSILYITTPNDYNGRAHRSCSAIVHDAYKFTQNVQCIRRQFRAAADCTRAGESCPLKDECPYKCSPSSVTTKDLHLMLVSLVKSYI